MSGTFEELALTAEQPPATPEWHGFHHIAVVTPHLDETIRFYRDVLGMSVGDVYPATPRRGRHCFIRPGEALTWGFHFFEHPGAELFAIRDVLASLFADPAAAARFSFMPGALQHIALALPNAPAAATLRERLSEHGVPTTDIYALGPVRNFMFPDTTGLLLEAAWPSAA
jgi:catechol 2,3-dioxygenase-like lactoylglutathione lyase family enzyme